jgi:hypothetical protein
MHDTVKMPQVLAYESLPQGMAAPSIGSHDEISLRQVCFGRVGHFSPYGWAYAENNGSFGIGMKGDNEGMEISQKLITAKSFSMTLKRNVWNEMPPDMSNYELNDKY